MSTLFPKTITYQQVAGSFINGVYTKVNTPSTFIGSVQPVTGKDIESLNVGREDRGKVKIYSNTPLNVSIEGIQTKPGDVVEWQGQKWEVIQEMIFQNDLIEHYKYIGEFRGTV